MKYASLTRRNLSLKSALKGKCLPSAKPLLRQPAARTAPAVSTRDSRSRLAYPLLLAEGDELREIRRLDGHVRAPQLAAGAAAVPRHTDDGRDPRALRQRQRESVLAAAGADHDDFLPRESVRPLCGVSPLEE